ncbi:hypothetical protein [Aquiflexum sp.]|uniref:hypothetical protein n=1 Tax=Aquiflexum sp. TaxID=1872584 RepID=UPI003593EE30
MKFELIIKPEAEHDILEYAKWYEQKREFLGIEFIEEIDHKLSLIQVNPLHYQIR